MGNTCKYSACVRHAKVLQGSVVFLLLGFSLPGREQQFGATSVRPVVSGLRLVQLVFKELIYWEGLGNTPHLDHETRGCNPFPSSFWGPKVAPSPSSHL